MAFWLFAQPVLAQDRAHIRFADTGNAGKRFCWDSESGAITQPIEVVASPGGCGTGKYQISWGDGNVTAVSEGEQVYPHTYNLTSFKNNCASGLLEYNIIIASTDDNCIDINIARLSINKVPIAKPTVTAACEDKASTFTNSSCGLTGQTLSWLWEFSDGRTFQTQNIAGQMFNDPGQEYWVKLSVRSDICGTSSTSEPERFNLKKLPATQAAITDFDSEVLCFGEGGDSTLLLDASGSLLTTRFPWRISGGPYSITELVRSDSSVIRIKIEGQANYTISFTAGNECGSAPQAFTHTFEALPSPKLNLIPQADGCEELKYQLVNGTVGASYTLNDLPIGLGEERVLGVSETPYIVKGEISNACGVKTEIDTFYVHSKEPAEITSLPNDTTLCLGTQPVELQASRQGGEWSTESIQKIGGNTVFFPNQVGEFVVTYKVGTGLCLSSSSGNVKVINELAKASIGLDGLDTACSPTSVIFSNRSEGHDQGYTLWDFGDGSPEIETSGDTISHVFTAVDDEAIYTVSMKVRNACGLAENRRNVRILPNTIKPLFELSHEQICPNVEMAFTDATVPSPGNWLWYFGDGTRSNLPDPVHQYTAPGTYHVTLVAGNQCATDSVTHVVSVVTPPEPSFTVASERLCEGEEIQFANQTDTRYTFLWEFGEEGASDSVNFEPAYTYASEGIYNVKLTIFDGSKACAASRELPVTVMPILKADFSVVADENACEPALVKFENHTQSADTWHWEFSDGTTTRTSQVKEPLIPFRKGSYTFHLTASGEGACASEESKSAYFDFASCKVEIPEAFTPNGDLHGDRYTLFGDGIDRIIYMRIRNRWGEVVYEMKDVPAGSQSNGESWDGTKGGKPLPADMYVFEAKVRYRDQTESDVVRGNFYLVR